MYTGLTGTLNHSLHTQHILKPIFYFYRFSPGLFLSPLAYVPYSPSGVRESPQNSLNKWTRAPQPTHTAVFIFCSPSCLPMVHRKANTPLRRGKQNTASSHWKADTPTTLFRRKLGVQNRLGERRMRRVRTSGWKQGRTSTKKKQPKQNKTKNHPKHFLQRHSTHRLARQFDSFQKMLNFRIHEWMPKWREEATCQIRQTQVKTEVKDFYKPDKERKNINRSQTQLPQPVIGENNKVIMFCKGIN